MRLENKQIGAHGLNCIIFVNSIYIYYQYCTTRSRIEGRKRRCGAINPCYGSDALDCGAAAWYSKVRWNNSPRRIIIDWVHEFSIRDTDGTFSERPGQEYFILPNTGAYDQTHCSVRFKNGGYQLGPNYAICPYDNGRFKLRIQNFQEFLKKRFLTKGSLFKNILHPPQPHRYAFNGASPWFLEGQKAQLTSTYGTATGFFAKCRPRPSGWMMLLDRVFI